VGASSGTNLVGALAAAALMRDEGRHGSIVTLLCDSGERYVSTYYNAQWLAGQGFDLAEPLAAIRRAVEHGAGLPASVLAHHA